MVEYETGFESYYPGVSNNELKERFGSRVRFYYKDGSYIREYLDENDYSLQKHIYDAKTNLFYATDIFNPDTLTYYSAADTMYSSYEIQEGGEETILGCRCPSTIITVANFEKRVGDTIHFRSQYFFCEKLAVNPVYYRNFYIWYDVIQKRKSVAIKFTEEVPGMFKITYTAIRIDHRKIPQEIFEIDKKLILKRMENLK